MGGLLFQAFIYLCAAVIAVPIAKRLGLGSVLGYLLAGIAIGPVIGLVGSETREIQHFAEFTGDTFYAHTDEEAAAKNPFFDGRVAHGYLIVSFAAGLFVDPDFGPVLANYGVDDLRFAKPVNYGDSLKVRLTCKQKTLRAGTGYGEVRWDAEVTNQDDEIVAQYDVLTMVATDEQWASVQ